MSWIVANIKWIVIVSGTLTATMFYAAIAPGRPAVQLRRNAGGSARGAQAGTAVVLDSIMIAAFAWYLVASRLET